MLTKEMILKAISDSENEFFGLRYDNNNYSINDRCENSHQWYQDADNLENFEELTEEELDELYNSEIGCYDAGELEGTCCIKVTEDTIDDALSRIKMYKYDDTCELILISGDYAEEGNDIEEIIIENAVVIAK
jgi:hypothetical protein